MNNNFKSFNSPTFLAYFLIAPAAIYILAIVAWPLAETIRLSFTNSGLAGEEYIGLENYEKMWGSKKFNQTVIRTFVWMFFSVSFKLIIGLIGAVLLNAKLPGRSMFRVFIMPPWVVPIAIGMLGWLWFIMVILEL
jgi:multiple sugar transport system permease protein